MDVAADQRLTIRVCIDEAQRRRALGEDVRRGLAAERKTLPCKYFYDERGSELFERITELPEYYQTRTELGILASIADELIADFGFQELVELGSGSATKTRILLDAMDRRDRLVRYVPFDVSEAMLRSSAADLLGRYSGLVVHGVIGDFQCHLGEVPPPRGRRLVIFLGSTIGNLDGDARHAFLSAVRQLLGPGDAFLLGVDLVKDVAVLEAAYDDSAGVTAEFNRNILRVVNRELAADFNPDAFRHLAFYNRAEDRIEMHLVAERAQCVRVAALDLTFEIAPDETIWTEISCKFTRESAAAMLTDAGMSLARWYTDPHDRFGLALALSPSLR